jgi:hypothetical protein
MPSSYEYNKPLNTEYKYYGSEKQIYNISPPKFACSTITSVNFSDYRNELRDMQNKLESFEKKLCIYF